MKKRIYLDNHSTTAVDPRVLNAMLPYFSERFGNAASKSHVFGWEAEEAVQEAREHVAALLGAEPKEIVFTSGATESDNLALMGSACVLRHKGMHLITSNIEHKAVLDTCKALAQEGFVITYLPVDKCGLISTNELRKAIRSDTILVSIMHANNEIGVLQNIDEIGAICRSFGVLFHTDAAQSVGKVPVNVESSRIDLLSVSAHKLYGPKGIGALYVRSDGPRVHLKPIINGGGHERGMRSGTLNVPAIVGFGKACALALVEGEGEAQRLLALREKLREGLLSELDDVYVNGDLEKRLPGNLNVSFAGVTGESILMGLEDEIAVSSGSACSSHSIEPSHVLRAIGRTPELADSSIRFGIGRFTTQADIDYAISRVVELTIHLRALPQRQICNR